MTAAAEVAFNNFIRRWVAPAMQPHLLDNDNNDGERVRTLIRDLAAQRPAAPIASKPAPTHHAQDAVEHTCELCGRVGTRRYVETPTGWKCAPSSAEACARKAGAKAAPPRPVKPEYAHRNGRGLPGATSDAPATPPAPPKVIPIKREPAPAPRPAQPSSPNVTARCQDCTRYVNTAIQVVAEYHRRHGAPQRGRNA